MEHINIWLQLPELFHNNICPNLPELFKSCNLSRVIVWLLLKFAVAMPLGIIDVWDLVIQDQCVWLSVRMNDGSLLFRWTQEPPKNIWEDSKIICRKVLYTIDKRGISWNHCCEKNGHFTVVLWFRLMVFWGEVLLFYLYPRMGSFKTVIPRSSSSLTAHISVL